MVARFWVRSGETIWLDEDGYLLEPSLHGWLSSKLFVLDALASEPCLLLLGEPGMGKSTTLTEHVRVAREQPTKLFQLKTVDAADLERSLFAEAWFRDWRANNTTLHLFLDSLDECQGRAPTLTAKLIILLRALPPDCSARLRLRIACRTQQVPPSLMDGLRQLWPQAASYQLAPLRRQDVQAEAQRCQQPEAILHDIRTRRLGPLASRPITLKLLIRLAARGPLPSSRAAIYQQSCRLLCEEPDQTRRYLAWQRPQLDANNRLELAAHIAAAMLLGQRLGIWMGLEPAPHADDWTVHELWQSAIRMSGQSTVWTEHHVREVLEDTALFTSLEENRTGWSHQTYPEYLAASWLARQHIHDSELLTLLTPAEDPEHVAPPYYELASWLASLRAGVFERLVATQPQSLLHSDSPSDFAWRERVCASLLGQCANDRIHRIPWREETYVGLGHPGLAGQLRPYISNRECNLAVRQVALLMARSCQVRELAPLLLEKTLDPSEYVKIRETASGTLLDIADKQTLAQLTPLLTLPPGEDPDDQLKGTALAALWTHRLISPRQLLDALSPPRNPHLIGRYQGFLGRLTEEWPVEALPVALDWVCSQRRSDYLTHTFQELMQSFLRESFLRSSENPGLLPGLARAVATRMRHHEDPLADEHADTGGPLLSAYGAQRRMLITAVIELPDAPDRICEHLGIGLGRRSWLNADDENWLLSQLRMAPAELRGRWARLIANFVYSVTHTLTDAVHATVHEFPELLDEMADDLKPVELGSERAHRMKQAYQLRQERAELIGEQEKKRDARLAALSPRNVRVQQAFERAEKAGELSWQRLENALRLDEQGREDPALDHAGFVGCSGWRDCDVATQARAVEAAHDYLQVSQPPELPVQRTGNQMTIFADTVFGFRAFQLLMQADFARLSKLDQGTWARWIPVLLEYPLANAWEPLPVLLRTAYRAVPDAFLTAVLARLDDDNQRQDSCLRIDLLHQCQDERMLQAMMEWACSREVHPGLLHTLVRELLLAHPSAVDRVASAIIPASPLPAGPARERAVAVSSVLLRSGNAQAWRQLTDAFDADPQLLLEVLDYGGWHGELAGMAALPNEALATLYIVLRRRYPDREDDGTEERTENGHDQPIYRMHEVSHEEDMAGLRDALLVALGQRPQRTALHAVQLIMRDFPQSRRLKWMHHGLSEAWRTAAVKAESADAPIEHLLARLTAIRTRTRKEIGQRFRTDSDFDAFCSDHFPMVQARFTNGMDRLQKLDLLLREIDPETLSAALKHQSTE